MTGVVEQIKTQAAALPTAQRAEIAEFLLGSLDVPNTADDADGLAYRLELDRRIAAIRAGRAKGKPVDQFLAEMEARFP